MSFAAHSEKSVSSEVLLYPSLLTFSALGGAADCQKSFVARGNPRYAKSAKPPSDLEKAIGYVFKNKRLRQRALRKTGPIKGMYYTHRQLEFLGDAVLGFCTADLLLEKKPRAYKKDVNHQLAFWVSNRNLANLAQLLHLDHIVLITQNKAHTRWLQNTKKSGRGFFFKVGRFFGGFVGGRVSGWRL